MKKKLCLSLILFVLINEAVSRVMLLDFSTKGYSFNRQTLTEGSQSCLLINVLANEVVNDGLYKGCRPLLVFQVFSMSVTELDKTHYFETVSISAILNNQALPLLKKDLGPRSITDLIQTSAIESATIITDSLIIQDGNTTMLIKGFVKTDLFNVIEYEQFHSLQVNQTIFNTQSLITPVHSWVADSIPVFDASYIDKKIFLYSKDSAGYFFYKFPERNEDDPLSFPTGYLYKKEYGVIALRSKNIWWNKGDGYLPGNSICTSKEYYSFK